ncbi:TonB-dependent receptor domain-containing protein [Fluviicola sp.]|jgi:iron complex outermembrane receptor protein|uniref:TonB-dependent receptor n=1 Tax=Fluviicola sp. TaxID=1917219 RepID=UPI00281EA534|nr:TonB-dependent receptor [Fluviicola sp.]MDR0802257.1 TonB-dependent receptor [Fluviicola sp.]
MKQVLLLLFFLPQYLFSQELSGVVRDGETNEIIPFARIRIMGGMQTQSNENGEFSLPVDVFPVKCIVSAADYYTDTILVSNPRIEIRLKPLVSVKELGPVVVAASRRQQLVEELAVSLDIIKPELIANKGIMDLEQAVDQVPGAYAMDGQVSIRGGSGFTYGAGSRVLVLWNEIPLLSADVADAKWNAIPIENVQQIEVIKGASSVLYGSGALNGMISLIEREPTEKTSLNVQVQGGVYDNPKRSTLKWWSKNPQFYQGDLTFAKQFGRFGLTLGAYGYTNDGYRQGETEGRGRFNGTISYRPKNIKNFKASLGWNAQLQKTGNFIIWQSDTFAYQPYGGADTSLPGSSLTYNRGVRVSVDPTVKYIDKFGNKHQLRGRLYFVDNKNFTNLSQSSKSEMWYGDYQFQRGWNSNSWVLTTGVTAIANEVRSYLFGDHSSLNSALYLQGEKNWEKLNIVLGVRGEYFQQDGIRGDSDYYFGKDSAKKIPIRPVIRSGIHYAIAKHTHLRASFGQGVRYPSIAERYTTTSVGGLVIFPNPQLKPEMGWAAEIGVKQGVKIGKWRGFVDVAGFINHYDNMMEFTFGNYKPDSIPFNFFDPNASGYYKKWLGFRAQNAESAEITGAEISVSGEGKIGPVSILALLGYTYMNPVSKNRDSTYRTTFSDTSANMLKYRFKHLAKADIQLEYKGISIGGSMRMNSYMQNIDAIFENGVLGQQILPGLKTYRAEHKGITVVFDMRIGYTYREKYKVAFIVNNLANAEYMTRPGDVQAPRSFMLQLSYKI